MKSHDDIFAAVLQHCGITEADLSRETRRAAIMRIGHMHGAARIWEKPREIEDQLEDARSKLTAAIAAVERLDKHAIVLARREATKAQDQEFERKLVEIAESGTSKEQQRAEMGKAIDANPPLSPAEYIDHATVAKIKELSEALVRPIEAAIPHVQEGRGRRKNLRAYYVVEHAYLLFSEITGQTPTFWNGGSTPFSRLVEYLFNAYDIRSTIRKPIESAMHKFGPDN